MARREAPAFSRGNAAQTNNGCATWRAISLAVAREKEEGPAPVGKVTAYPAPQRIRAAERWLRLFDN